MKTMTFVLVTLLAALASVGFNCINDNFTVAVNLPLTVDLTVNPGPTGTKSGSATVRFADKIDQSYLGKLQNVRYYDIRVSTVGTYSGNVSNGVLTIDGTPILTFAGTWNQFNTPQSLLGSSTLVRPDSRGIVILMNKLNSFKSDPNIQATLSASCTISDPSGNVPSGLMVHFEILTQVDAEVGGGN